MLSDNAATLIQGLGVLSGSSSSDPFSQHLMMNNIKHLRIPVRSAWIGASYERMIRSVKSCLYKVIGRKRQNYFDLITLFSDIQNSVNSRPLSYKSCDDNVLPITPNDFLKFSPGRSLHLDHLSGSQIPIPNRENLVRSLEWREDVAEKFRDLFYTEYLLSLRESGQGILTQGWENRIKVDDVVLIEHPEKPRPFWQLGRVVELLPGKDHVVRCVKVMRTDKSISVHSISKLYPLELSIINEIESNSDSSNVVSDEQSIVPAVREPRKAAMRCRELLKKCN